VIGFNALSADAYNRFMGRFSEPLGVRFAELAGVRRGSGRSTWGADPGP
jgi:hypothetical protein